MHLSLNEIFFCLSLSKKYKKSLATCLTLTVVFIVGACIRKPNEMMFVITKKIRNNFDPFQSLSIYRERNIVETAFRQFKVLNGADRLYCTQTSYKGKIFIHLLAQTLRMMMSVSATRNQTADNKLPSDSLNKLMLKLQTLQASRPLGRGI